MNQYNLYIQYKYNYNEKFNFILKLAVGSIPVFGEYLIHKKKSFFNKEFIPFDIFQIYEILSKLWQFIWSVLNINSNMMTLKT